MNKEGLHYLLLLLVIDIIMIDILTLTFLLRECVHQKLKLLTNFNK